ncbi:MAG: hypothetical protein ABI654_05405 [Betaproteobacteria bacterium]
MQLVAGARFCGGCGTKLGGAAPDQARPGGPLSPAAAPTVAPPEFRSMEVKVLDAGDRFVLSGEESSQVERVLQKYLTRGAKLITPVSKVGRSFAAACSIPPKTRNMDETQTLKLQDVVDAAAAAEAEDAVDGCRVEQAGFKRIVYGPSLIAVQVRLERMKHFGAEVIGEIEEQGDEWVAVVDVGGAKNTGFRW